MQLRKPGSRRRNDSGAGALRVLGATVRGLLVELLAIVREMLRIPAALYMRVAELAGEIVLTAWLVVWPLLKRAWRLARLGLRVAEREVTPARAALAVAAGAAILLAASQFADYRSVAISSAQYGSLDVIAPPPEVDSVRAGSAHAWVGIPLGLAALAAVAACAAGRTRAAWALVPIGLATVAVSLLIDAPKGLDEGSTAIAFDDAKASLLGGFWVQLVCGALLVALTPLLVRVLSPGDGPAAAVGRRRGPPLTASPASGAGR